MAKSAEVPDQYKDIPGAFPYTLKGRVMWFKPIGSGQVMLLQRFRARLAHLRQQNEDDAYLRLVFDVSVKTLNVIDSLFLDPADREWVEELMITGAIDVQDLLPVMSGKNAPPDDDAEVEVKPRAVKRAVKKASVANARRTQR